MLLILLFLFLPLVVMLVVTLAPIILSIRSKEDKKNTGFQFLCRSCSSGSCCSRSAERHDLVPLCRKAAVRSVDAQSSCEGAAAFR